MSIFCAVAIALFTLDATYAADGASPIHDCPDCPAMVLVPAGSFAMGATAQDAVREGVSPARAATAAPRHDVTIASAFYLGATEVTRDQFEAFARDTGYRPQGPCTTYDQVQRGFAASADHDWRHAGFSQSGNHPVVCVDWSDANAYVAWLSVRTGKHYRLPSEAEWEYAARAGSISSRYWGDARELACKYANVADRAWAQAFRSSASDIFPCADGYATTAPVASFEPNPLRLFDMIGNVWEWTQDCFNPSYDGAPTNGIAWEKGDCTRRVARGGSWVSPARHVTAAFRDGDSATYRSSYLGFRVARAP